MPRDGLRRRPGRRAVRAYASQTQANERLAGEWHIIVVGPHRAEALIARDLGDGGEDQARRFDYVHTLDRELIVRAARSLMLSIVPSDAARAPSYEACAA